MASDASDSAAAIIVVLGVCGLFIFLLFGLMGISRQWKLKIQKRLMKALKARRNDKDEFRETYGYSWDYFMAFRVYDEFDPINEAQAFYSIKYVLNRLTAGGLEVRLFYSLQRKEVFCKIRCPLTRLCKHADLVDYTLALDPVSLQTLCEAGREGAWDPLKIPVKSDLTPLNPYAHIHAKYEYDEEIHRTRQDVLGIYKKWPRMQLREVVQGKRLSEGEEHEDDGDVSNPMSAPEDVLEEGISLRDEASIFRDIDRLKLIHGIITYHGEGGCGLDPYSLMRDECLLAYAPLHDFVSLRTLEAQWISLLSPPWAQPLEAVKDYFGEKVGLYFVFLGVYTTWLIPVAAVGVIVWIDIAASGNRLDAPSVPYFAGIIGLWSALFLENFKRTEARTAMEWGMTGFEEAEADRAAFEGEPSQSPITGKPSKYFAPWAAYKASLYSQGVLLALMMGVIGIIACIFTIEAVIQNEGFTVGDMEMSTVIGALLLTLQITLLNASFGSLAITLTEQENHRTETMFEDSLIVKTFSFQFLSSFGALFYIAFAKPFIAVDRCGVSGCMGDLQITLSTIFISRLLLGNALELVIPILMTKWERSTRKGIAKVNKDRESKAQRETCIEMSPVNSLGSDGDAAQTSSYKTDMSEVEKALVQPSYHVMLGPFEDFSEMVIQFGYTTMFVAAFPLACLLSLVNNYVEMRVDAWKLCHLTRRPEPRSMEDIGTWAGILEIISMSSIFINSGLVAFTSGTCLDYTWPERVWIFILMASGLFAIRGLVAWLIPDVPEDVTIQLDRQEYIAGKVIDNIEDEGDALGKSNFEAPNFLVIPTDDDPL